MIGHVLSWGCGVFYNTQKYSWLFILHYFKPQSNTFLSVTFARTVCGHHHTEGGEVSQLETSLHATHFKCAGHVRAFLQDLITPHTSVGLQLHQNASRVLETFRLVIGDGLAITKNSWLALALLNMPGTARIRTSSSQQNTTRPTITAMNKIW